MNQKFKLATKRITAVAASAALVSSAVAGAPLANYPSNFVDNGEFNGTVVVGSDAASSDMTAAESLISDLESEFSGEQNKVRIDYREESEGGERLSAVRSNNALNYGESIGDVTEKTGFDNSDSDMLTDGTFSNSISDEDYEQSLSLDNGEFNYALRDDVDGIDEITEGIYYQNDETFANYTLELDNDLDLEDNEDDLIGEDLELMGQTFTIGEIMTSTQAVDELTLLGGANKATVGEGESTTVSSDGEEFEVEIQSVSSGSSDDKVLLSVNGESTTINEFDTEEVGGVTVAVTELVPSSRDSVKGYAEVVVGGQKVTLSGDGDMVQVNDEDVDDVSDNYEVTSEIADGMESISLTYKVSDDVLLESGDMLEDVLFNAFNLEYSGTNNPDYSEISLSENNDDLTVEGVTEDGVDFNRDFLHINDTEDSNASVWVKGDRDDNRIFFNNSNRDISDASFEGVTYDATSVTFDTGNNDLDGNGLLIQRDTEEQYMYQIDKVDTNDNEVDFEELLREENEEEIEVDNWGTDLGTNFATSDDGQNVTIDFAELGNQIAFENEMLMTLTDAETDNLADTLSTLTFELNSDDVSADEDAEESDSVSVDLSLDENDEEFDISDVTGAFVNEGNEDNGVDNSDVQTFVTKYGIMAEYDNDEGRSLSIMTPEEQVEGMADIVFGDSSSEEMSVTVDESALEDERERLEEEGYTITGTEDVESEEVEFDIDGAITDSEADLEAGNHIVIGGPAVNAAARAYLGIDEYTVDQAGVEEGEGVARYFEDSNSVLIYGYSAEDTTAMVDDVIEGEADFE